MDFLLNGWNIILIILGFGLLIAVHELGHFLAARWAGIRCESFAIGIGPTVVAYRPGVGWAVGSTDQLCIRRFGKSALQMSDAELAANGVSETEYSLRALPLGGFVRMLGQDDLNPTETSTQARSYQRVAIGKRMVVISAGVIANVACALLFFVVAFMVGVEFPAPVIGATAPGSPAATTPAANAQAAGVTEPGLRAGDTVLTIDGAPVLTFQDIQLAAAMSSADTSRTLMVRRPGMETPLEFHITPVYNDEMGVQLFGVAPGLTSTLVIPHRSQREQVAALMQQSGLEDLPGGSRLVTVDGRPISMEEDLSALVTASAGRPLTAQWELPDGRKVERLIQPVAQFQTMELPGSGAADEERQAQPGLLGLSPCLRVEAISPDSPNHGILQAGDLILRVGDTPVSTRAALQQALQESTTGSPPVLGILRDGQIHQVQAQVTRDWLNRHPRLGILLGWAWDAPLVGSVVDRVVAYEDSTETIHPTPAATLDVLPLSRITEVNAAPVQDWVQIRRALQEAVASGAAQGTDVTVELAWQLPTSGRETVRGTMTITPQDAQRLLALGWSSPIHPSLFEPLSVTLQAGGNPFTAMGMGLRQTHQMISNTYLTLDRLLRGNVAVKHLRGPVGIVHLGAYVPDRGWTYLIFFLAAISVNLAVINFLPLPILDGGLFLYLVYERITGRPPSIAFQNAAMLAGLCLIGSIFLLTFYQDIMRLISP